MKKPLSWILLGTWGLGSAVALSLLMSSHWISHPNDELKGIGFSSASSSERSLLQVHHFLSTSCACSKKVMKHLVARGSLASAHESVHLIVDSKQAGRELALARELTQSGFDVETLEEEAAVHKFNVTVVPQLVALFSGKIAYQGGYGRDQQHSEVYEDERILKKLVLNQNLKNTDQFSLFGCANGHLKKTKLDPFRIKYAN